MAKLFLGTREVTPVLPVSDAPTYYIEKAKTGNSLTASSNPIDLTGITELNTGCLSYQYYYLMNCYYISI